MSSRPTTSKAVPAAPFVTLNAGFLAFFALVTITAIVAVSMQRAAWDMRAVIAAAVATSALVCITLLVHELVYATAANHRTRRVELVELGFIGAVRRFERDPDAPIDAVRASLAAPAASALLASLGIAIGAAVRGPAGDILTWWGEASLLYAAFTLLPGLPLDGGRAVRAALWAASGDRPRATRAAGLIGHWAGVAMMILGALVLMFEPSRVLHGAWLIVLGWSWRRAAAAEVLRHGLARALAGKDVFELMRRQVDAVPPDMSVDVFMREYLPTTPSQTLYPVVEAGRLLGVVGLDQTLAAQDGQTVGDVMIPVERVLAVPPIADAAEAVGMLATRGIEEAPVVQSGYLVGLLRLEDVRRRAALSAL
jgi:CBS domain-containing protein